MKPTWIDPDWRSWEFPKKVPDDMKRLHEYAEDIRKNHPDLWAMGGNIQGNKSYKRLSRIIKRGEFRRRDRDFILDWQAWIARHKHNYRLPGLIANLKWLSIPEKGWNYMKQALDSAK